MGVYLGPDFEASQAKQREVLSRPTGFDWSKLDRSGIECGLGLITNPPPVSYVLTKTMKHEVKGSSSQELC